MMTRLAAILVIVFGALSLWAAPAAAHAGHLHAGAVKTVQISDVHSAGSLQVKAAITHQDHRSDAKPLILNAQVEINAAVSEKETVFVSAASDHDNGDGLCCCNSGGSLCSPAAAAILATPDFSEPFLTPRNLHGIGNDNGDGRNTTPTLQPPKLIA